MTGQLPGAAAGFHSAAGVYDTTGTEFFGHLATALVESARIAPGARVLDAGCGAGAATLPAARAAGPGGVVTGLDGSPDMLARAGLAARAAGLERIRWLQADAEDPPLPSGSLDVIVSSSVIQFLDSPRQAARRWLALLASGGTLAVSWGLAQDPEWVPVMDAFDRRVPGPHPGFEQFLRRPPFDAPASMGRFLSGTGYTDVTTVVLQVTSVYTSPGQWWEATRGQAPYVISWRHIPAGALADAQAEAAGLLERLRDGDGMIRRTLQFGLTTARRPRTLAA